MALSTLRRVRTMMGLDHLGLDTAVGMGLGAALVWFLWNKLDEMDAPEKRPRRMRKFDLDDLELYSGKDGRLCYVAVNDEVFDVTQDRELFSLNGGKVLESQDVENFREKYPKVGTLIRPRDFTLEQLREFDGTNGKPVYVAAKGVVYDVDPAFYGPDGPYGVMAGRDATRALALVSLEEADVNNPRTDDLTWTDLSTLEDWIAKFEFKYQRVGYLIDEKSGYAPARPTFLKKERQAVKLKEKIEITHDTRLFRFAFPDERMRFGLPVGKHVKIFCPNPKPTVEGEWNGKKDPEAGKPEIERKYTPSSSDDEIGYFDLVIKVYKGGIIDRFPDGGKMSQYMDTLEIGDSLEVSGPYGLIEYKGKGAINIKRKDRKVKHIGMLAGGTGITPMLQLITAVLKDREDETKMSLLFANQTEQDILVRDMLEEHAKNHPTRFKLWYTLDRPPKDWPYSTGFIDADMIKAHLPPPSDECVILMCGPPPMIQFACKANLDKLGYPKESQVEF